MDLIALLASYGPWAWVVAGFVLLALELVAPGGVLLWLGVAGVLTGLASLFQPISAPVQWLLFGVVSPASIFTWLRYTRGRVETSDRPLLNRRAERYLGHEAVLAEPIADGYGRLAVEDTIWRISGPDLAAGKRVRVVGADGPVLKVEAI